MHSIVSLIAQGGLYAAAALAVVVWLTASRSEKVALAVEMVVGLVVVAILVKVAGALHTDPRPFVVHPSERPWFPHPADNGFPSDHTAVASATGFVVLRHRRAAGFALLGLAVLIGLARVLAHVHHVQDVVAGLLIGLVAAAAGVSVWGVVRGTSWARRAAGTEGAQESTSRGPFGRP